MNHDTTVGRAIEQDSFAHIDRHAGDHGYTPQQWTLVRRLIHTSGDFAFNGLVRFHPQAVAAAMAALAAGCPIIVDVQMVAAGISSKRLARFGNPVHQFMNDPQVARQANALGTTRAVQAMRQAWHLGLLDGAVVAIGNAPTALLELLRLVAEEGVRPALVAGMPVGFIAAAESKEALASHQQLPWIITHGTKGGSTLTVAAIHALLDLTP